MSKHIILRFRDLITEEDGAINDHLTLIENFGEVWWGWWMKQLEVPPKSLFKDIYSEIEDTGFVLLYLFNTGSNKFYQAKISKIYVAPQNTTIRTPNPQTSPSYYHRGSYPAWFLINKIEEVNFVDLDIYLDSLPTKPNFDEKYSNLLNQKISNLNDLREMDVTLWVVNKNE